jgi:hypothetical protein
MTTGSKSQGLQFRLTGVTGQSFNSHTKQNVRKRIESILYLETPPGDAVKLAYVGSTELSPTNNLFIGDRSDSLYDNSRTGTIQEFIGTNQPVSINNKNFVVTQIFNEADSGNIPLYYKHILSDTSTLVAESVRIYDKDFNPVSVDKYKLSLIVEHDEDTGIPTTTPIEYHLYNNLESYFDNDTGEYEVYFVQYTEVVSGSEITKTQLLDNELAYKEATFEDIWYVTNDLKPWSFAYVYDNETEMRLSANTEYAVKYLERNRMRVDAPVALSDTDPWFPRVVNGSFSTAYSGDGVKYQIPEFQNQAFNPIEPYKTAVLVRSAKINTHLTKLPHNGLQSGSLFSSLYLVAELDGVVQYAVTNNEFRDGDEYRDLDNERVYNADGDLVTWSYSDLLGIDSLSGIVHVSFDILDSYELYATYSYTEEHFELTSLNMNPIFDQTAHNQLRAVFIVPESAPNGNLGTQTESVRWVKVTPSGLIEATNQDNSGGNEDLNVDVRLEDSDGYKLEGVLGLYYNWRATAMTLSVQEVIANGTISVNSTDGFPRSGWIRFRDPDETTGYMKYAKYVERTDTTFVLADSGEVPEASGGVFIDADATIELVNFIDERTTLSTRTAADELLAIPPIPSFTPVSFSRYFMLAEMCINPSHSHKELVFIDLREDGGGIIPEKYEEAKAIQPQAQWFSNFNDSRGQPYPGNAVMVVKVDATVLDRFTEEEVKEIVDQNMPMGVKSLIRYYGYEPHVLLVWPDLGGSL